MRHPTQVLVAGAGPVGLTAAYELARRGLRVRLIDAALAPADTSRAIATHPRTLEVYDQLGIADAMIARGLPIRAFTMFNNGHRLARLDADYTTSPTQFPYTIAIDQVFTEAVLREALAGLGVAVEWGVALADFSDTGDGVVTRTLGPGGRAGEEIHSAWLLGCDGGHSTVRKQLGLPLVGDVSETWLIADAHVDTDLPRNSIYWIRSGATPLMMAPLPGDRRWRMLDTVDVSYDGDAAAIARRFSRKLTRGAGTPVTVEPPGWVSVFTAQQRMVSAMSRGRVFVAGDAAHVHSPASGQGMNTGIHEAYNLAWKLALVEQGHAGAELLETYSAERAPVGRALLSSTKRATALIALKNSLAGIALPIVFGLMRLIPAMKVRGQRTTLGKISGLNIAYPDSSLTTAGPGGAHPAPGERARRITIDPAAPGWRAVREELRDTRWTLLTFGGASGGGAAGHAEAAQLARECVPWLSVRTVTSDGSVTSDGTCRTGALADPDGALATAMGAADGTWILIRPDGYVAARGAAITAAAVRTALAPAHMNWAARAAATATTRGGSR